MEADTCSKASCVIFLHCSERIQKMSQAWALDKAVFLPSDWLDEPHRVAQHCTYSVQGVREPRGSTSSSSKKTWGNLPATVITCSSSQPTVSALLLSPATIHLPGLISSTSLEDWKDKEISWPQKHAVSSLPNLYTSEFFPSTLPEGPPPPSQTQFQCLERCQE